jgi:hypothetical protein
MKFVVATGTPDMIRELQRCPGSERFELRAGSVPSTSDGCDAALLSLPLAAERYGADPTNHGPQVLVNERGDGAPGTIVTLPVLELPVDDSPAQGDGAFWTEWALGNAVDAMRSALGATDDLVLLLHVEAAVMDRRPCSTMKALVQFAVETI